jgi:hypothetical protein
MADGGATVDAALAKPYLNQVHSLIDQVKKDYMPVYGNKSLPSVWEPTDSLFGFFIGINDVLNTHNANDPVLMSRIFDEYYNLVDIVSAPLTFVRMKAESP